MDPPLIEPSTGMYRPPLVVSISADTTRPGDSLYYTVQTAQNAAEVSGIGGTSQEPRPQPYRGAFSIHESGRAKVTAFVRRAGEPDAPKATALFMLDRQAPPPAELQWGSIMHMSREPAPAVNVSTLDAAMRNASLDTNAVIASNKRFLHFVELPEVIRSFEPFSVTMFLVDGCGYPVPMPDTNPILAITAEPAHGGSDAPSVVRVPCVSHQTDNTSDPISWEAVANMLSLDERSLHRVGESTTWDSYATCAPAIAPTARYVGVTFVVANSCRAIVGLHRADVDASSRNAWRTMPYSLHLSADMDDLGSQPFYRIYENGKVVEDVGTRAFNTGDTFSIKMRSNGIVVYTINGCVVYVSHNACDVGDAKTDKTGASHLCATVKLASQVTHPALRDIGLVKSETPSVVKVTGLLWRGSGAKATPETAALTGTHQQLMLRGWVCGAEHVPATASVKLREKPVPRWAFGATSLVSMFALGSFGCQAGHVSGALSSAKPAGLCLMEGAPNAVAGQWLSPEAALRMAPDAAQLRQRQRQASAAPPGVHGTPHPAPQRAQQQHQPQPSSTKQPPPVTTPQRVGPTMEDDEIAVPMRLEAAGRRDDRDDFSPPRRPAAHTLHHHQQQPAATRRNEPPQQHQQQQQQQQPGSPVGERRVNLRDIIRGGGPVQDDY